MCAGELSQMCNAFAELLPKFAKLRKSSAQIWPLRAGPDDDSSLASEQALVHPWLHETNEEQWAG